MSALWPHIRVLRAEAKALEHEADSLGNETSEQLTVKVMLYKSAIAKLSAADEIEAGEQELIEKLGVKAKGGS